MKFINTILFTLMLAAPRAAAAAGEPQVVLDEIEVRGGEGLTREMLLGALSLSTGTPMPRSELDERILAGRRRLEAMALYDSVDAQLTKGGARDHYRLVVTTGSARAWYAGLSADAKLDRTDRSYNGAKSVAKSHHEDLYGGSRALFGSRFRAELGVESVISEELSPFNDYKSESKAARLALYDPSIASTPWFAGINLRYDAMVGRQGDDGTYNLDSHNESSGQTAGVVLGRRFGLFSASASALRLGERTSYKTSYRQDGVRHDDNSSQRFYFSFIVAELRYSEKSGLVLLEPGLTAAVTMFRLIAEHYSTPYTHAAVEHTWTWRDSGLTPAASYDWSYSTDCVNDRCDVAALDRRYDLQLKYEQALSTSLVGGLAVGYFADLPANHRFALNPSHRPRIKASVEATSGQYLIDLAFVYGYPGTEGGVSGSFDLSRPRLTQ